MSKIDPTDSPHTPAKNYICIGVMWLFIFLGIGGCFFIADHDRTKPLIEITTKP